MKFKLQKPFSAKKSTFSSLVVACCLGGLAATPAVAQLTWNGGGGSPSDGSATWDAASTNWWNGASTTWADSSNAVFGVGTGSNTAFTVTLGSGFNPTVGNLTFANQAYTVTGQTINLGATSGIQVDAGSATIASVLGGGSATLTKSGSGTLTLANANTYTGTTTVSDGNLKLSSASGPAISGNLTVAGGKWLLVTAANQLGTNSALTINGEMVLQGNDLTVAGLSGSGSSIQNDHNWSPLGQGASGTATLTVNNSSNCTFSGVIRDTVVGYGKIAMIKSGSGTLTLTADNSFTGGMTVNAGTLALAGGNGARSAGAGTLTINSGGTVDASAGVNNFGYVTSTPGTAIPIVIHGGTLISNNDNHLNSLTMEAGIVSGGTSASGLFMGTCNSIPATITTLASSNPALISSIITPWNTVTFDVADGSAATDLLVSGAIANTYGAAGGITKTGNGTLVLTAAASYTGDTTITAGTLQLGDGTSGHDGTINSSASIINNATLAYNLSSNASSSQVISGSGDLTKSGAGTLLLASNNTYSGTTTVNGGTLEMAGASGWSLNGSRAGNHVIVNSGATLRALYSHQFGWTGTLADITINNGGTFNGSRGHYIGQLALNGNATVSGTDYLGLTSGLISYAGTGSQAGSIGQNLHLQDVDGNAVNVTVNVSGNNPVGDLTISGVLSGPTGVGLTKTGTGTLVLSADNTYTGNTAVANGTLAIIGQLLIKVDGTANNSISGAGNLFYDGLLNLDLATANRTNGNSWHIINVNGFAAPPTFGPYFGVTSTLGAFDGSVPGIWTLFNGSDTTWTFNQSTGDLTLAITGNDYASWYASYSLTGGDTGDDDHDGLTNQQEYAFGLIPNSGASVNPITNPLNKANGKFSYTRRDPSLGTGLSYTIWTSTDLVLWNLDGAASQAVTTTAGQVQTVEVTVSPGLQSNSKLFVQVRAN